MKLVGKGSCLLALLTSFAMVWTSAAGAEERDASGYAETIPEAVRVTILRLGGQDRVKSVEGGGGGQAREGCAWSLLYVPELNDVPYGSSAGPMPHPDARFGLLLCDGQIVRPVWVAPEDVVDLDAAARAEAQRYVEEVLRPAVSIGANPAAKGLVGLRSWFWVEGFGGQVTAPPITAFGMTIDVRMATGSVTWDFGDGTVVDGDLGRAYPEESTVQHAHQRSGTYTVTASLELVPEYRVDGGPWMTLPPLTAVASVDHPVEERQAVITER
jgi:hypothetical protein